MDSELRPRSEVSDPAKAGETPLPSSHLNRRASFVATREDPFDDEEGAEVKFRTLRWWYVRP